MYIKEWKSIVRSYPLKNSIGGIVLRDAIFYAPVTFILPLQISHVKIQEGLFSLTITDKNGKFFGIFNSIATELDPVAEGCYGKIVVESIVDNLYQEYDTSIPIEISTVKLYEEISVPSITIGEDVLRGNIFFKDDSNIKYTVVPQDETTDTIQINSMQSITPKCSYSLPILTINQVTPDTDGVIWLESLSPHIQIEFLDSKRVLLKSDLHNVDFDKRALSGAEGSIGSEGESGIDGEPGRNVPLDQPFDPQKLYGGGYYQNNGNFYTKNIDAFLVENNWGISLRDGRYWLMDKDKSSTTYPKFQLETIPTCSSSCSTRILIGDDEGYLTVLDNSTGAVLSSTRVAEETYIDSVTMKDPTSYAVLCGSKLYIYAGGELYPYDVTDVLKIKYVGDDLYLMKTSGRVQVWGRYDINLADPRDTTDTDGTFIIGKSGLIYKIAALPLNYTTILNCAEDLSSIDTKDGLTIITGANGAIYKYEGGLFAKIPSPSIKNWLSVKIISNDGAWIYGGF